MLISSLSISKRENTSSPGARKYATSIIWNPASSGYGFRTKRIERFQHGLSKPKSSSIFSFHMKNTMPTTISRHWSHARSGDCQKDLHQLYELSINFNKLARIHLVRSINRKIIREEEFYTLDAEARYKALLANEKWLLRSIPLKDIASYIGITPQALSNIRKRI